MTGIIPAHAGLTAWPCRDDCSIRDHPRACGAHTNALQKKLSMPGSSPRMRGSLSHTWHRNTGAGIIPAHAGLTPWISSRSLPDRDHPRACGAHKYPLPGRDILKGSSPRMRGSRERRLHAVLRHGIIPAHAGLTDIIKVKNRMVRDHPRACGAHIASPFQSLATQGSSPRMRGSRFFLVFFCVENGIIPAHAGLTNSS